MQSLKRRNVNNAKTVNTMYHIKRDSAFLCKQDLGKYGKLFLKTSKPSHISFNLAHKTNLKISCCKDCQKRYYEILDKLKNPIIL